MSEANKTVCLCHPVSSLKRVSSETFPYSPNDVFCHVGSVGSAHVSWCVGRVEFVLLPELSCCSCGVLTRSVVDILILLSSICLTVSSFSLFWASSRGFVSEYFVVFRTDFMFVHA